MALPKPGCAGWFASMIALVLAALLAVGGAVTLARSEPPIRTIRAGGQVIAMTVASKSDMTVMTDPDGVAR